MESQKRNSRRAVRWMRSGRRSIRLALDQERLDIVIGMVREYRIINISAVLSRIGNNDLRDPLLRSVEAHPNLKAHAGPKTIFLQWRMTASRPAR